MKRINHIVAVSLVVLTVACGYPISVQPSSIAGTWNALTYTFINKDDLDDVVDLIPAGASFTITFTSDGEYTSTFTSTDGEPETRSGTFTVEGSILTLAESGQDSTDPFLATRDEDRMTLLTGNREYDFDGDTVEEPAELNIFLSRE